MALVPSIYKTVINSETRTIDELYQNLKDISDVNKWLLKKF